MLQPGLLLLRAAKGQAAVPARCERRVLLLLLQVLQVLQAAQ